MNSKEYLVKVLKYHQDSNSDEFWESFYEFIVISYSEEQRHGLSSLSKTLKAFSIKNEAHLIEVYARGLLILAKKEGKKIYGRDGFNP